MSLRHELLDNSTSLFGVSSVEIKSNSKSSKHCSMAIQSLSFHVNNMRLLRSNGNMEIAKYLLPPLTKAISALARERNWEPFNTTGDFDLSSSAPLAYDCWELVAMGVIHESFISYNSGSEKCSFSVNKLAKSYLISPDTVTSERLLEKHNEICKQLDLLIEENTLASQSD